MAGFILQYDRRGYGCKDMLKIFSRYNCNQLLSFTTLERLNFFLEILFRPTGLSGNPS